MHTKRRWCAVSVWLDHCRRSVIAAVITLDLTNDKTSTMIVPMQNSPDTSPSVSATPPAPESYGLSDVISWCNDNDGFLIFLLTLVYVLTTLWMAYLMVRANRLTAKIHNEQTRPYLVFDIQVTDGNVHAVLLNISNTPAYDVSVKLEPDIVIATALQQAGTTEIQLTSHEIGMVAPNREIREFLDVGHQFKDNNELVFAGNIMYRDSSKNKYKDPVNIDISYYPAVNRLTVKKTPEQLEKIAKSLDSIANKNA